MLQLLLQHLLIFLFKYAIFDIQEPSYLASFCQIKPCLILKLHRHPLAVFFYSK